jgi:hypothetical protein
VSAATKLEQLTREHELASVELSSLRSAYDQLAATALIEGKPTPTSPKELAKADDRVRALHAAIVRLRAEVEAEAAADRERQLAQVHERIAKLHGERQAMTDLATAMLHLSNRLFSAALSNATGGGSFHPRIAGMAIVSDWPAGVIAPQLKFAHAELVALGIDSSTAGKTCKVGGEDCPVRRTECRELSTKLYDLLRHEGLLAIELPPIKP